MEFSLNKFLHTVSILCLAFAAVLGTSVYATGQTDPIGRENYYLSTLPSGYMPFEEFAKEFAFGSISTEQLHPETKQLSQVMHTNVLKGMELLVKVDEGVVQGLEAFFPSIETLVPIFADKIGQEGRIFLVGSGSSGRVAIDIAAKCGSKFPKFREQIQGVIAGGDSAFIRAKEGFEDSETDGEVALKNENLGPHDIVILISASGSASFNVGCGHFSANQGASVFYFYNSHNIPLRTQRLFDRNVNPVVPLCIDIGPQAIGGSTRLQTATLAEACLGALLGSAFYFKQGEERLSKAYPTELASKMKQGLELIKDRLRMIQKFVLMEVEVFSSPNSNFKRLKDVSDEGYVTFVALEESIREVLIDSTETSPTFSTNPIRRECERHQRRAEFRAYLIGREDNNNAWKALLGRKVQYLDIQETESFILADETEGIHSFSNRPKGKGNFVIGVAKISDSHSIPPQMLHVLNAVKRQGGAVGLLLLCTSQLSEEKIKELEHAYDCVLVMDKTPSDAIGFSETILLKQVLNLVSNSSMVLMNKVHGNHMIDVRASNKKLIDRCMRLIKDIWSDHEQKVPDDKFLYQYVVYVSAMKSAYEENGIYTPSVVKVVLTMLALKKSPAEFQEVIDFLAEKGERIDWIGG